VSAAGPPKNVDYALSHIRQIQTQSFQAFTFQFSLPFYVLRNHGELRHDSRERANGQPLRRSWKLDCLCESSPATESPSGSSWCLYEAQTSIVLIGIDDRVWTAYATIDTYYEPDSANSVGFYEAEWNDHGVLLDPMTGNGGIREFSRPLWDARTYFLSVLEAHLDNYLFELDGITRAMKEVVDKRYARHATRAP
jgi:hypothetical protein